MWLRGWSAVTVLPGYVNTPKGGKKQHTVCLQIHFRRKHTLYIGFWYKAEKWKLEYYTFNVSTPTVSPRARSANIVCVIDSTETEPQEKSHSEFFAHPKFLLARVQCFVNLLELVDCFTQFNAPCQDVIERRLARWWFCTRGLPRISGSLTPVGHISSFRPYLTSQSSCQHDYGECCLKWNNSFLV